MIRKHLDEQLVSGAAFGLAAPESFGKGAIQADPLLAVLVKRLVETAGSIDSALDRFSCVAQRLGIPDEPAGNEALSADHAPGYLGDLNHWITNLDAMASRAHALARRLESAA